MSDTLNSHSRATTIHNPFYWGSTDPATDPAKDVRPGDVWADESSGVNSIVLKKRNDEGTGWIVKNPNTGDVSASAIEYGVAVSDETTGITTGTAKIVFRMPRAMRLTKIKSSLSVASTANPVTVDIKIAGNSVFGTNKLSIDQNEKTSETAATPASFTAQDVADDAEVQVDITGAGTAAKGLKIVFLGIRL